MHLFSERPAAGLAVAAEGQRARVLRLELLLYELCPQPAPGAQLGDLQVEVHADAPEEREARRELIHRQAVAQT